ncbi:MAG: hypothetical protein GX495_16745 [Chloroflexi bacterium]|jgi:hypothetical protein|nr:hypothetical protein [Chloroflexota bacterium]
MFNNGKYSWKHRDQIEDVERYLDDVLVPVEPRAEFVSASKERLLQAASAENTGTLRTLRYALFGVAGAASFVLLVITGIHTWPRLQDAVKQWKQVRQAGTPEAAPLTP